MIGFGSASGSTHDDTSTAAPTASKTLMNRPRARMVHASLVLFALAIVGRAVQVQLVDTDQWTALAEDQQVESEVIAPPRGVITDAYGNVMVESRELMRLGFTPKNIRKYKKRGAKKSDPFIDARAIVRKGLKALDIPDKTIRRVLDTTVKWVELPALYLPSDVERFAGVPGVTRKRVLKRYVTASPGFVGVLGTVNSAHVATGGIEQELDSLLQGVGGYSARVKDGRGNRLETPNFDEVAAKPGHSIRLTINKSLQDLAERELARGIAETGASGGDVVMMDPRDGAVLAMAGARNRQASVSATSLTESYEPGSVMKPFVIARAMELGRVQPDEIINTESGKWTVAKRVVTDEHKAPTMTMRDVIRFSSNIGTGKIALRLSEQEEYESLRDLGFGVPTGLPYPSESRGRLPAPKWHPQTATAVAMGYEMAATPMQIAAAYASIANGGDLLQPALVREIKDPSGNVVFEHQRTVVRRAMTSETAKIMRDILSTVVDSGTAVAADMATFDVAGKSGTARIAQAGNYTVKRYNATFVGMFPAQAPQYVMIVRLTEPQGQFFGGVVAGRVVKSILQGALATREASLDRPALAALAKPLPQPKAKPLSPSAVAAAERASATFDSLRAPTPAAPPPIAAPSRVIVSLPMAGARTVAVKNAKGGTAVPSVYGLNTRQAVRTLHAAGFHVSLRNGTASRTRPEAGAVLRTGSVVVLETPK